MISFKNLSVYLNKGDVRCEESAKNIVVEQQQCSTPEFKEDSISMAQSDIFPLAQKQIACSQSEPKRAFKKLVKRTVSDNFWDREADLEYPCLKPNKREYIKPFLATTEKIRFADLRNKSGRILEFNCYKETELGFSEEIQKLLKETHVDEDVETDDELLNIHEDLVKQELLDAISQEKLKRTAMRDFKEPPQSAFFRKLNFSPEY